MTTGTRGEQGQICEEGGRGRRPEGMARGGVSSKRRTNTAIWWEISGRVPPGAVNVRDSLAGTTNEMFELFLRHYPRGESARDGGRNRPSAKQMYNPEKGQPTSTDPKQARKPLTAPTHVTSQNATRHRKRSTRGLGMTSGFMERRIESMKNRPVGSETQN